MESFSIIRSTFVTLLRGWPLFLLYALWTLVFAPLAYLMLSIPEASNTTVLVSALLAIACAGSFCLLQAATAYWFRQASAGERISLNRSSLFGLVRNSFRTGASVALVTAVLVFFGWLVTLALPVVPADKSSTAQINEPLTGEAPDSTPQEREEPRPDEITKKDFKTRIFWIEAIRAALLWLVLPLLAIRLWNEAAFNGIGGMFKSIKDRAWHAWSPLSLLVGIIALLFIVGVPVGLISFRPKFESNWMDILSFISRMILAWALPVFGWLLAMAFTAATLRSESSTATE
jgi:hypothetical protein